MVENNSIDPAGMATKLATAYTAPAQSLLASQSGTANAGSAALSKLQGSLSSFGSSLGSLSGQGGLAPLSATLSDPEVATASAATSAVPGTYSLFVEQVATNHQVALSDLPAAQANMAGKITLSLGNGETFEVLLSNADADGNGSLSYVEIARAINQAGGNQGKITAMVATANGQQQLLLSSRVSGEDGRISLGTAQDAQQQDVAPEFKRAWLAQPTELMPAQNAVVWLGPQGSGLRIEQSSNTIDAIDGLSLELSRPQAQGAGPLTLSVAQDGAATKTNVQGFVDAYNALRSSLDSLTGAGSRGKDEGVKHEDGGNGPDAAKSAASSASDPGPLANDASVRALKDRLASLLRQDFGGHSLREVGVSADRYGKLSLDARKLQSTLDTAPETLDAVFGQASLAGSTGLLGAFNGIVKQWTDVSSGFIKQRQESLQLQQKSLGARQTKLEERYDQLYDRYLKQFSSLQNMQQQMSQTSSQLESLSADK